MEQASIVIVGGGVVGCAIACALSMSWKDVLLLEALPRVGMTASSRDSGVIHSGLHYPPGSLKARHCVRGNQLMYEFCAAHGVPHRRTGKLAVASSPAEIADLAKLMTNREANRVENLRIIDRAARPHPDNLARKIC
jgi:L-2-hydroxyglutarate oxidase LhgO